MDSSVSEYSAIFGGPVWDQNVMLKWLPVAR